MRRPARAPLRARRRRAAAATTARARGRCRRRPASRRQSPSRAGAGRTHGCVPPLRNNGLKGNSIRAWSIVCAGECSGVRVRHGVCLRQSGASREAPCASRCDRNAVRVRRTDNGRMRVIAGTYRSRLLVAPNGTGTRPTSDRLRETLFNILAPRIARLPVRRSVCGHGRGGDRGDQPRRGAGVVRGEGGAGAGSHPRESEGVEDCRRGLRWRNAARGRCWSGWRRPRQKSPASWWTWCIWTRRGRRRRSTRRRCTCWAARAGGRCWRRSAGGRGT